jgi:SpoVK/Ycf46/Vps4 family AAA+-type ATPase
MFGFVLKDRVHDLLDITGLDEPQLAQNAIDRLVMKPENKETIKAIVQTYADTADEHGARFSADFIQGKGEGQVFLLHGPPGTGKTLTAESVAEYTKRPLLSITAADLGHEPTELETNLLRFFRNATNWDAIVLLDEADVYLEARSPHDLERNSAVSSKHTHTFSILRESLKSNECCAVFLRALDYFQGILFLTTNRVGQFDEAFMSRIHVSIAYDPLTDSARKEIWSGLYRKLEEDHKRGGELIMVSPYAQRYIETDDLVKALKWNGREIRNAFQTAVALAMFDAKKEAKEAGTPATGGQKIIEMGRGHFEQVVTMSSAFKDYLKKFRGVDEEDYAYKSKIRMDRSGSVVEPGLPFMQRQR